MFRELRVVILILCYSNPSPPLRALRYCLQLNLYAFILESEYGFVVSSMFLAVAHPLRARGAIIEVPRLDSEIRALVEYEIAAGRATEPIAGPEAPFNLM